MVKMHKSPTRRRFPCAGDVPRFHHLCVRQRRVFRRTAGQSRSFCSFPRFRRWWRGHALCVYVSRSLKRKAPGDEIRNPPPERIEFSLSLMMCAYMYNSRFTLSDTFHGKKERLSLSPSTDKHAFALERERERERESVY